MGMSLPYSVPKYANSLQIPAQASFDIALSVTNPGDGNPFSIPVRSW